MVEKAEEMSEMRWKIHGEGLARPNQSKSVCGD